MKTLTEQINQILEEKNLNESDNLTDITKNIRKDLKAKGYSTNQISVRGNRGGLSWSINIVIKDPVNVDYNIVKDIAKKYESFDRDKNSREIMSGGNTFVFVDYDREVEDKIASEYDSAIDALIKKLETMHGSFYNLPHRAAVKISHDSKFGKNRERFYFISGKDSTRKIHEIGRSALALELAKLKIKPSDLK